MGAHLPHNIVARTPLDLIGHEVLTARTLERSFPEFILLGAEAKLSKAPLTYDSALKHS